VDGTFVFPDARGSIGRMSAPQRSSGRTVSRRVPAGTSVDPAQPRSYGRGGTPPAVRAAEDAAPVTAGLGADLPHPVAVPGSLLAAAVRVPEPSLTIDTVRRDRAEPAAAAPAGPHPVELAGLLHELTARLLGADDVPQALDRLAAFAAATVPGALRCSVALIGRAARRSSRPPVAPPRPSTTCSTPTATAPASRRPAPGPWSPPPSCSPTRAGRGWPNPPGRRACTASWRSRWTCSAPRSGR